MLLEDGPIPDLPQPSAAPGPASLEAAYSVAAVLDAVDAPPACRRDIRGDFSLAANLPEVATIMPHGMVRLAAAAAQPDCEMRLVRYVTPASIADVLQFHYTMAKRADMEPAIHVLPEASLIADRRGRFLRVFARESAGNLTAVDLVTWTD
jgi:hypothetical protein